MKRIIVFRFHRSPVACKNRLQLLRLFNPDIKIYGLFGGNEMDFPKIRKKLGKDLEHIYCISGKSREWKWRNGDLALRLWYLDYGKDIAFDMIHFIEWDLIVLDSISQIYSHIPAEGIGLSGLIPLRDIENRWPWTAKEPYRSEWHKFYSLLKDKYQYDLEPYASIAIGACLPRLFLDKYSAADIPELCNDELRVTLFGQILGFKLYDTGFYKWHDKEEEKYFNVEIRNIETKTIRKELKRLNGRRVFHPYRNVFCGLTDCNRMYNTWYNIIRKSKDIAKLVLNKKA